MTSLLLYAVPLGGGLLVALLAGRRGWSPPLWATLLVAIALRVVLLVFTQRYGPQPYDLTYDFQDTAKNVVAGTEPVLGVRYGGWHFLPMMAYVLAGQYALGELLGVPWPVIARLVPMAADLVLLVLIGRLADEFGAGKGNLRRFQYACLPLALMVSSVHGQIVPIALAFGVGALLMALRGRPILGGVLVGFAAAANSWPALLIPGVILALTGLRPRLVAGAWAIAVPGLFFLSETVVFGVPISELPALAKAILSTRPVTGEWGWSAILTNGAQVVDPAISRIGTPLLLAALVVVFVVWRKAHPITLTAAVLMIFLIVTFRMGAQYLLWPLPYLLARPPARGLTPYIVASGVWSFWGYIYLTRLTREEWLVQHDTWTLQSPVVIASLVYAFPSPRPWRRPLPEGGEHAEPDKRPRASGDTPDGRAAASPDEAEPDPSTDEPAEREGARA
ncbi:MAG: hypothetical protein GEV11_20495 [Streptosporangiales bacterium]|nr:hypothetical protein [Streptosporangiales bacterium]